jgi:hypothetical protein
MTNDHKTEEQAEQSGGPERAEARPEDPETNTSPRGNGEADSGETERSEEELGNVLGH